MRKPVNMGVKILRFSGEMLFLNGKHYLPFVENCVAEGCGFDMWAYSRIDTVRPGALEPFKRAGVKWLAPGLEAGNQKVRREVFKSSFKEVNIEMCLRIGQADVNMISNCVFGSANELRFRDYGGNGTSLTRRIWNGSRVDLAWRRGAISRI
jgi:anaerobic magnesium-protoporphyrin IX monomethyl ester cyclase